MIKVKLRPEQGIKVKTTPAQSPDVKLKTVYLYDADWIPEINKAVEEANESAEKAKTSAESAEASANSAAESARNADADADNASESAGLAAQEAQKAIDASTKATKEADAAAESAYQSQQSALAAHEYAQNASSDAENALESLEHVLASVAEAKTSELNAKESETKAKESEQKATQEANASAESAYQSQQSALSAYEYASNAEADASNVRETLDLVLDAETAATKAAQTATEKAQQATDGANIATQKAGVSTEQANIAIEKADEASQFALECQAIKDSLGNVYKFKGSVNTYNDLPSQGNEVGDVYNVIETDVNYAWDGEKWDALGGVVNGLDVQIKGTSIVSEGVANIPVATTSVLGVVKTSPNQGISAFSAGDLCIISANQNDISTKTQTYKPIVPKTLDYAVKTSVTTNTIDLTDEEKQAAQDWLGISGGGATSLEDIAVAGEGIEFKPEIEPNYSVVGTPTIENNVASNFSSSSCLTTENPFVAEECTRVEMVLVFEQPALASNPIISNEIPSQAPYFRVNASSVGQIGFQYIDTAGQTKTFMGALGITANTKTWYKCIGDVSDGTFTQFKSTDEGQTWTLISQLSGFTSPSTETGSLLYWGKYGKTTTYFNGKIYLEDSYIKTTSASGEKTLRPVEATGKTEVSATAPEVDLTGYLKNTATGSNSLAIGDNATAIYSQGVAIGYNAKANATDAIQIGSGTNSSAGTFQVGSYRLLSSGKIPEERLPSSVAKNTSANSYSLAVGSSSYPASATVGYATALGPSAIVSAQYAIQLGKGTNSEANTMNVGLSDSLNVQLLDANGKIPAERLPDDIIGDFVDLTSDQDIAGNKNFTGTLTWNGKSHTSWSMPSGTFTNLTTNDGATYFTAPADGWYCIRLSAGTKEYNLYCINTTTGVGTCMVSAGGEAYASCPVKKGDAVKIFRKGTVDYCRFVYAEGES